MKNIIKGPEPSLLLQYRQCSPNNSWEHFQRARRKSSRRHEVKNAITSDQGGICAYCEIDLKEADSNGNADFRVEHFHPKSDNSTSHNWHLDWQNLLGCCHGGSQHGVVDSAKRFSSPDHSCDVPKGKKNLTGKILNPLQLPAFPPVFSCSRTTGELSVNEQNCQEHGISVAQANNTIIELRLDADRLTSFRSAVLNDLNERLQAYSRAGMDIGVARQHLAAALLNKNAKGHWPPFFTAIRSFLGRDAEQHLRNTGYSG